MSILETLTEALINTIMNAVLVENVYGFIKVLKNLTALIALQNKDLAFSGIFYSE
jgi:hypothetical protein